MLLSRRRLLILLGVVIVGAVIAVLGWLARPRWSVERVRDTVVTTIQSEAPASDLVTGRVGISARRDLRDLGRFSWLPAWLDLPGVNFLDAEARVEVAGEALYGFDVRELTAEMIEVHPDGLVEVTLPPLRVIAVETDLGRLRVQSQEGVLRGGAGGGPPGSPVGRALFARGGGPGGQQGLVGAYTDLSDGSLVEVRELLGRTFRIPEPRPSFAWKMTGEQAVFLGYPVFQATAQHDSTFIEAWFTPEIPIPAGPAQYGGLPGLILTLTVDSNRVTYNATAIDTAAVIGELKAPSEGNEVTRAEYDRIVEEKMAELSRSRPGRRN